MLAILAATTAMAAPAEFRPGEVIVKYKDGAVRTRASMNALYDAAGVRSVERFSSRLGGMEHLFLDANVKTQDANAALLHDASVEYAQPNYIVRIPRYARTVSTRDGGIPCIPGFNIPGCDNGGGGGQMPQLPCIIPGIPFPPGCTDTPGPGPGPGPNPTEKPALMDAPAEVMPQIGRAHV